MFYHTVNEFLKQRWDDINEQIMQQSENCNILTVSGYNKWQELNKKIDELQKPKTVEYYCALDEMK